MPPAPADVADRFGQPGQRVVRLVFVFERNDARVFVLDEDPQKGRYVDDPPAHLDLAPLGRGLGHVLHVNVQEAIEKLLRGRQKVGDNADRVSDVDTQADSLVEVLDTLVHAFRRGKDLVGWAVVVDSDRNVVLLHLPLDIHEQFDFRRGHDDLHSRRLGVVECLVDFRHLLHGNHTASVERQSLATHLFGRRGDLVRLGVQRQMERLEADIRQPGSPGQRQCLVETELPERIRSNAELQRRARALEPEGELPRAQRRLARPSGRQTGGHRCDPAPCEKLSAAACLVWGRIASSEVHGEFSFLRVGG